MADKQYKRFAMNQPVGLRHAGLVLTCNEVKYSADGKTPVELKVHCVKVEDSPKPKAFIHWVASEDSVPCEVRIYKRL